MNRSLAAVTFLLPALLISPVSGQISNSANTLRLEEGAPAPPGSIDRLAWLAGYWRGEGLGGECEEMWSPPVGDRMNGIFTLRKDGELVFSEAMLLVEEEGSLVLKVKHFTADFVGWEDKEGFVSFPLVRLGDSEAYFNGLTLRRQPDGALSIYLVLASGGERTEHEFRMERQAL